MTAKIRQNLIDKRSETIPNHSDISTKKELATSWFTALRDSICAEFEQIETELSGGVFAGDAPGKFVRTPWQRADGGGGEMSVMKGRVFEKVGVNISTVYGEFDESFRKEIPGAQEDPRFWASGISLVAHMQSPLVPAVHMNTRMIVVGAQAANNSASHRAGQQAEAGDKKETPKIWFGGGADLNPMQENEADKTQFHAAFKQACDGVDPAYYAKFSQWCDEYFFIPHRNEPRGVGGIFYDHLETDWAKHFDLTKRVGSAFLEVYPAIIRGHMNETWSDEAREAQLYKRGRYTEFNLLHDRGTRFGLMTNGNIDAILMSLPPVAKWV
jgi:coproporphyrinogen III oxidase